MMDDNICGNSLLVVIVEKGKGSEVQNFVMKLGVRGTTAFYAHGTASNKILRLFELGDGHKEVIMIALPTRCEEQIINELKDKFHFERPGKGIIFSLALSGVYGSSHFDKDSIRSVSANFSPYQVVMTIVDKGRRDNILDFLEDNGFPNGTVIDAHGSAEKSNTFFHLMLEKEKDIFLVITTAEKALKLSMLLKEYLNLEAANSGILALLSLQQLIGVSLVLSDNTKVTSDYKKSSTHSMIFAIVDNDMDEAVIKSAESAGSTGGTIIHARGSRPFGGKTLFSWGVEPEREVVMIIAENDKVSDICSKINTDLQLEKPGQGIILVTPLQDTVGLVSN